jgi:glycerol kinase
VEKYILAIDSGTTSNRAILFDRAGGIAGQSQKEFTQIFPEPGWVEHDPEEIWDTQLRVIREVLERSGVDPRQIAGIGITNQRETAVVWDTQSGKPVGNAIVWQDRRTAGYCKSLVEEGIKRDSWPMPIFQLPRSDGYSTIRKG